MIFLKFLTIDFFWYSYSNITLYSNMTLCAESSENFSSGSVMKCDKCDTACSMNFIEWIIKKKAEDN